MPLNTNLTLNDIVKEVRKRLRRAEFNLDEEYRENGDDSSLFRFIKSEVETLEGILHFLHPKWDLEKEEKSNATKG